MKNFHLRKDKTCLNCGATVHDRFCSHCGQENTLPKESFKHLIGHFFADVTHYDSKFFRTLRDLVFKPGFLTMEYNAGKRVAYLNPIRMYIFVSAVFFLVLFSRNNNESDSNNPVNTGSPVNTYRQHLADSLRQLINSEDTNTIGAKEKGEIYSSLANRIDTAATPRDTLESINASINDHGEVVFQLKEGKFATIRQYVASQDSLPPGKRDNFVIRYAIKKLIYLTHEKYQRFQLVIKHNIEHDVPRIMFLLLPLFALFIGWCYSRKKYGYTQHIIFALHFHSFAFIFLMAMGVAQMFLPMDKTWFIVLLFEIGCIFIYLCFALRNVYSQSLVLSSLKALGIFILYVMALLLSMVTLMVVSFILLK